MLEGFKFMTKASAAGILAQRRAQVHERYLKLWAKKVLVSPESAVVPLKQVDYQLASKFEVRASGFSGFHRILYLHVTNEERDNYRRVF